MQVKISLPEGVVEALDVDRGDVSRSRFICRAIEAHLIARGKPAAVGLLASPAPGSASENFKSGAPREETAAPRRSRAGKAKKEPVVDGGVTELPKIAPRRWA
jgi:hypothetical protein